MSDVTFAAVGSITAYSMHRLLGLPFSAANTATTLGIGCYAPKVITNVAYAIVPDFVNAAARYIDKAVQENSNMFIVAIAKVAPFIVRSFVPAEAAELTRAHFTGGTRLPFGVPSALLAVTVSTTEGVAFTSEYVKHQTLQENIEKVFKEVGFIEEVIKAQQSPFSSYSPSSSYSLFCQNEIMSRLDPVKNKLKEMREIVKQASPIFGERVVEQAEQKVISLMDSAVVEHQSVLKLVNELRGGFSLSKGKEAIRTYEIWFSMIDGILKKPDFKEINEIMFKDMNPNKNMEAAKKALQQAAQAYTKGDPEAMNLALSEYRCAIYAVNQRVEIINEALDVYVNQHKRHQ